MKLQTERREVETSGVMSSHKFTIEAGGKAFGVFIDKMYSDKPQSITREIWSNAYDAHRMAGKLHVPFEVTFPSWHDSNFRCRDFGPGMSHEFMTGDYTVAFHSTKEDTNEAVGFLGIGRLSPFSYVESYSVVTFDGTTARHYSVFLDEDGVPDIAPMSEVKSDEPSGTQVSFPVAREDVSQFTKAANRVSLAFDVKPKVNGEDYTWPVLDEVFSGDGYMCFRDPQENSGLEYRTSYVKMGCVLYPIDANKFDTDVTQLLGQKLILDMNIGDVSNAASRETLSYGRRDPTVASISAKVKKVSETVAKEVAECILNEKYEWHRCILWKNLYNFGNVVSDQVKKCIEDEGELDNMDSRIRLLPNYPDVLLTDKPGYSITSHRILKWSGNDRRFTPKDKLCVYVQDQRRGRRDVRPNQRIKSHYDSSKHSGILWFKVDDTNIKETRKLIRSFPPSVDVFWVKDIPDVAGSTTTRSKVKVKQVKTGGRVSDKWYRHNVELSDTEMKDGGWYLRLSNNEVDDNFRPDGLIHHLKNMEKDDLVAKMHPLHLVPKTLWKRFDSQPQWKDLFEYALKLVKDEKKLLAHARKGTIQSAVYSHNDSRDYLHLKDKGGPLSKLKKRFDVTERTLYGMTPAQASYLLHMVLKKTVYDYKDQEAVRKEVAELVTKVEERYPLLKLISSCNKPEVQQYVDLINQGENK